MSVILNILLFILILGVIVFIHEFGHFTFAKLTGVYVYEFAIGMGPKLWSKKGKETEYSLRAIPIGGFCQMAGEDLDDDELKKIPKEKRLQSKTVWQRFLIMFFGAGNNFILALILLFAYGLIWGAPIMTPTISEVNNNYPCEIAGMSAGDVILEINDNKTSTIDDVQIYLTLAKPGTEVEFKVQKADGTIKEYDVTPVKEKVDGIESYKFGISFGGDTERGFVKSIKYSFIKFGALIKQMAIVIKSL